MALGNDRPRNYGVGSAHADLNLFMLMNNITYKTRTIVGNRTAIMVAPSNGNITLAFQRLASVEKHQNRDWRSYDDQTGELIVTGTSQFDCIRKTIMKRCSL